MLNKTITYEDLDGNEITEVFWFNISKAEVAEMAMINDAEKGGYLEYLKRIIAFKDAGELLSVFKEIIRLSIGRRSEDNKRFIKTPDIAEEFMQTDAYSVLFMELFTDETGQAAAEFMNSVFPSDLTEKALEDGKKALKARTDETRPLYQQENRRPTPEEIAAMSSDEMVEAFAWAEENQPS